MNYNWEEIFKGTSSQELFKIYKGQTTKTGEAIHFAKKELDQRGFDLRDMEKNKKKWALINTLENETLDRLDISNQNTSYISFKKFILLLLGTLIFFYLLNWYDKKPLETFFHYIPLAFGLSGVWVIINNLIFKHQVKKRNERHLKIIELKNYIEQNFDSKDNDALQAEIEIKDKEIRGFFKLQLIIAILVAVIMTLVVIYNIYF